MWMKQGGEVVTESGARSSYCVPSCHTNSDKCARGLCLNSHQQWSAAAELVLDCTIAGSAVPWVGCRCAVHKLSLLQSTSRDDTPTQRLCTNLD